MADRQLIWKKRGKKFSAKITRGMGGNHTPEICHQVIHVDDYKQLALWLSDMKHLWSCPIDKAIHEYQKESSSAWPFG